ncbi:UNVERIFIED_CONTAM: hypothetical protein DES50_106151 [Williamsia faeni]
MTYPPAGPFGRPNPDPRQYPQHRAPQQPPLQQPQPGPWGPAPGYGSPHSGQPGQSGGWRASPPQPPRKNHNGLIIGAIVATLVVVLGVVITVAVLGGGNESTDNEVVADPSTSSSAEKSPGASPDEDDVAAAAEMRVELINEQDAVGLHQMACEADSRTESTAGYQDLFDENGPISASIDVQDVVVDGQVGTVEGVMSIENDSGDITWSFKKEDGEWRFCPSLNQTPTKDDDIITG